MPGFRGSAAAAGGSGFANGRNREQASAVLLAFHKPYGVLSQFTPDQAGQRTLAEFGLPAGVYPVGRLDLDSEGLLLLTDEPGFNHRLLDPSERHPRTYLAQVDGCPSRESLDRLSRGGLALKTHRCLPCRVRAFDEGEQPLFPPRVPPVRFRKSIPTTWIELVLNEGKNRQVRRMTAAVGHPTLRLIRTAVGRLPLGDLPPGHWRGLSDDERASVWQGVA